MRLEPPTNGINTHMKETPELLCEDTRSLGLKRYIPPNLTGTPVSDFSFQNLRNKFLMFESYPACGSLLQQPKQAKMIYVDADGLIYGVTLKEHNELSGLAKKGHKKYSDI